jgi:thiamine pyrophosphokinase
VRAIVFINGLVHDYNYLAQMVRPDDYLVGADGGTRHCVAIGRRPHVVVGDLDSIDPGLLERLAAEGVAIERHPPAKDQTDLELAIERALRDGAQEVILAGATGGRLDQTLANLLILAQRDWPKPVVLVEDGQTAQLLRGPGTLTLDHAPGDTVSAIPFSPEVTGITYAGLAYPLRNATLTFGSTRGVSNTVVHSPVRIEVASGLLLIVTGRTSPNPQPTEPSHGYSAD